MNKNLQNKLIFYFGSTFTYGFYRGVTFTHNQLYTYDNTKVPEILLSARIAGGFITGILYTNPFLQPLFLGKLMDRIEIKLTNKYPKDYKTSYYDIYNYNLRTL
jgi:hypothetical protein